MILILELNPIKSELIFSDPGTRDSIMSSSPDLHGTHPSFLGSSVQNVESITKALGEKVESLYMGDW